MRLLGAQVVRTPIGLSSDSKLTHTGECTVHPPDSYDLMYISYCEAIKRHHSWRRYLRPIQQREYSTRVSDIHKLMRLLMKPANPLAHELGTAREIIEAIEADAQAATRPSSGKLDVFFASAGTGGTLSGVAHGVKKAHNPDARVIGIDVVRIH